MAQPEKTVNGMIKITEQGEVLSYKYAVPQSASYELELAVGGLMKASRHLVADEVGGDNDFEEIMKSRKRNPLFIVDIAVPRDIEASVQEIPNVYLYTIDHLTEVINLNVGKRKQAAEAAVAAAPAAEEAAPASDAAETAAPVALD